MRFDDKLDTVFAQPAEDVSAIAATWMQIVDILAQDRGDLDSSQRAMSLERLATWRHKISIDRRRLSARSLAGRQISPDLVAFFADDAPPVAAALLSNVTLDVSAWKRLIPSMPPTSRALLRERRDLPTAVIVMLSSFGSSDFALPGAMGIAPADAPEQASTAERAVDASIQIRVLVERIEAFRKDKEASPDLGPVLDASIATDRFRFETGTDGIINWVDGAPRGSIIGIEIATMAEVGSHGVDGHAAGAFRRRTPFRNARLLVPGDGAISGEWLISGVPCFNEQDGRFFGYRCTARRPQRDERPLTQHISLFGAGMPADSVRQLVHELRTPLNAIRGFAEMIGSQVLGPVSSRYRAMANDIVSEAAKLLALFEDLDIAARLERGNAERRANASTDISGVVQAVASEFLPLTNRRQVHLRLSTGVNLPAVAIDGLTVERMVTRLLSTAVGLAQAGETITAEISQDNAAIVFAVDRPTAISDQTERELLDPSFVPEGDWPDAPMLGLGFALRLIANMARAENGRLVVGENRLSLHMPVKSDETGSTQLHS